MEVRLQKFLADAGIASRRKAEELILNGEIQVNKIVVTTLGTKVNPKKDKIYFKGNEIKIKNKRLYILLNKPAGYISASQDQFDNESVLNLIKTNERIFTVGRLDKDTTGVLLITNDGDFAYRVTHPKHNIEKTYIAHVLGKPTSHEMDKFERGLMIDGEKTSPAKIRIIEEGKRATVIEVRIHEGKNRQVKKMCEAIGHKVVKLHRKAIGRLTDEGLKEGQYREYSLQKLETLIF